MSVDELAAMLGEPGLVVVDCRWALNKPDHGRNAYRAGHIPGAVFADLETDLSSRIGPGRHPLPEPTTFDAMLGGWRVSPQSTVVAYDDAGGTIAARLWWMLSDQGHSTTYVLDGGIDAWIASGRDLEIGDPVHETRTPAGVATKAWAGIVEISGVANRSAGTVVIDARAPERFRGETEPIDPKPGHIPGAINIPTSENLSGGQFRSPAELRSRYMESGITEEDAVFVHCGSGVTACHDILALELAGFDRPLLYVGSWSEWSSTDQPVALGDASD
jgi:thiosulfate/3-mercaptopyruvate sulfurtransferase